MSDYGDGRKLGSPWVYYQYQIHKTPNFFATDPDTFRIFSKWFFDQVVYSLSADAGSFVLAGTDAYLARTQYILYPEEGTFTFTGEDATLVHYLVSDYTLDADAGTITLTGSSVTLEAYYPITAEEGTFEITGSTAALLYSRIMTASGVAYTVTGQAATLVYTKILLASEGSFVLVGQNVSFFKWVGSDLAPNDIIFYLYMSANERATSGVMQTVFTITALDASSFAKEISFMCTAAGHDSTVRCTTSEKIKMTINAGAFAGVLGSLKDKMGKVSIVSTAYVLSVGQLDQNIIFVSDIIASQSGRHSEYIMEYIR